MSTSQTNSLLSFGNPPFSLPWTVDINIVSVLPFSSGAVGESQGLGFWVEVFLFCFVYFCILHAPFSTWGCLLEQCHEILTCSGGTSSDETQIWGHSVAHWWVFPGAQLRTEPSLKLFFPLNKSCQVSSPWKTSAYQHHAVCILTAGKDSSAHSVKEIYFFFLLYSILE